MWDDVTLHTTEEYKIKHQPCLCMGGLRELAAIPGRTGNGPPVMPLPTILTWQYTLLDGQRQQSRVAVSKL
jgi:hypothetical protein